MRIRIDYLIVADVYVKKQSVYLSEWTKTSNIACEQMQ